MKVLKFREEFRKHRPDLELRVAQTNSVIVCDDILNVPFRNCFLTFGSERIAPVLDALTAGISIAKMTCVAVTRSTPSFTKRRAKSGTRAFPSPAGTIGSDMLHKNYISYLGTPLQRVPENSTRKLETDAT